MSHFKYCCILVATLAMALSCLESSAQFRSEAFSQQYNNDSPSTTDSTDVMFSFKEYFSGLKHKTELKIGTMTAGSALIIGGSQIYNKQTWKLPFVYGAIGGGLGAGLIMNSQGRQDIANYCFIGAGVAYWASLMDGVVNFKPSDYPHAGKATLYSLLVPGLGQIYNKEYWKLPIYLGGMAFAIHYYSDCAANYKRFRDIYLLSTEGGAQDIPISSQQAQYYKNVYRRYRDYSALAIAAIYLLQVIDANVFSYMHNFEVDDNLSMKVMPTVIQQDFQFASNSSTLQPSAFGFKLGITF